MFRAGSVTSRHSGAGESIFASRLSLTSRITDTDGMIPFDHAPVVRGTFHERRRDARQPVVRPAKVLCERTGRLLWGQTTNVSTSGLLLATQDQPDLKPGDTVRVAVAWTRQQALVRSDDMFTATVVRSVGIEGNRQLALKLDEVRDLAASA